MHGRTESQAKSRAAQEVGGDARPIGRANAPGRAVELGLHARPAARRPEAARADVVDQVTREALATEARGSFSAHDVSDVLNRLSRSHRKPSVIQVDNGTEFASRALDAWTIVRM